jgi:uncharacterized membrane protein (GlpM family)
MKPIYKAILWVIGLSCFLLGYHYFDPSHSHLAPKCPFWLLTGYYCPGCGSQRAIHAFLNGHIWEGIRYNYLLVPALLYVMALTIVPKEGRVYSALSGSTACWIIFAVFIAWWIGRNLLGV